MVLNIDREKSPVTYNLLLQPTVIYVKSLQYQKVTNVQQYIFWNQI